jgi:hypothetical protein
MNRKVGRTQNCTPNDALTRLRQAERYLEVAEAVLADETADETAERATVATGNAVLAAIAAADAICCAAAGSRYRGSDHRQAAAHLEQVTGDKKLASLLRDVVDLKDAGHYGLSNIGSSRAKSVLRKADQLVGAARDRVR